MFKNSCYFVGGGGVGKTKSAKAAMAKKDETNDKDDVRDAENLEPPFRGDVEVSEKNKFSGLRKK